MDSTGMALDLLQAVTEESAATMESSTTATTVNTPTTTKPCTPTSSSSCCLPPSHYVSQFRIGGQPILPPLMTEEKRREMQLMREQAVQLEAKYKQARAVRSLSTLYSTTTIAQEQHLEQTEKEQQQQVAINKIRTLQELCALSMAKKKKNSDSNITPTLTPIPIPVNVASGESLTVRHSMPQLQQTKTFIFDSTQLPPPPPPLVPRRRPQTLDLELEVEQESDSEMGTIPIICVDPPTPQQSQQLQPQPQPSPEPELLAYQDCKREGQNGQPRAAICPSPSCSPMLNCRRRKLNTITSKILHFERALDTGIRRTTSPAPPPVATVVWQDSRMQRSSTSPALNGECAADAALMLRSRSFTLDEPSQALVDHMQRTAEAAAATDPKGRSQPLMRCRFADKKSALTPSNSPGRSFVSMSYAHLRRDTVESKAKRVQRNNSNSRICSRSSSSTHTSFRGSPQRSRSSPNNVLHCTAATLRNQQQLEELLESALHESCSTDTHERVQLALAKRKMFHDIKCAHRNRFQQLVHYQHEEQRRMQDEFDRQQQFLLDEICAEINVSNYAHNAHNSVSEYTSTDDLEQLHETLSQLQCRRSSPELPERRLLSNLRSSQPSTTPQSSSCSEAPISTLPSINITITSPTVSSPANSTPTTTTATTAATPQTSPSSLMGLDSFLATETSCRAAAGQQSSARKRLFDSTPEQSLITQPTDVLALPPQKESTMQSDLIVRPTVRNSPTVGNRSARQRQSSPKKTNQPSAGSAPQKSPMRSKTPKLSPPSSKPHQNRNAVSPMRVAARNQLASPTRAQSQQRAASNTRRNVSPSRQSRYASKKP
ncbi:uncharacterized protein LOC115627499 isoform X2 [Scaptodrosophila lebanonensis]|uniref:Uncharacterized protein LOC115627499 isoform X2 n=1 Tax=Drosophila lebanonensis TaxID=7225 RepID=A0A6J2TVW7_DROLE|nr:uncharacterized protein LOC115627499 isoform X2 [Scaptodrosophila lebanonensis]